MTSYRYLYMYKLNTAEQPDLFFSEDFKLKLEIIAEKMEENRAPINTNGRVEGEGFGKIELLTIDDKHCIRSICISLSSLGNYNEAFFQQGDFITERKQHKYYTKSTLILTEDSEVIIMFDNSIEEKAKSKVKAQIEQLGFEATSLQINDPLIRNIKDKYSWRAATFNKIVKHGDNTRRVSFEIDPANDQDRSLIDDQYREHGELAHIKFELPYNSNGVETYKTVTLYSNGNRIVVNEEEFNDSQNFNEFIIYLMKQLQSLS